MGGKAGRIALRVGVAVTLIMLLIQLSGVELSRFQQVSPRHIALTLLFSILTLLLRAANFRLIAGSDAHSSFGNWMSLTASHQVLFSAVPSGLGDLSFPHLARAKPGLPLLAAARLIALSRARDALSLLALAAFGLALEGRMPPWCALFSGIFLALSLQLEPLIARLLRVLPQNTRLATRLSQTVAPESLAPGWHCRITRSFGSLAIWLSAAAAVGASFAAAATVLAPGDVFVMIAGLNVVGLLAVSIAGLGIAEAGAAAILIWLGWSPDGAATAALIGRPLLLVCVLLACALVAAFAWLLCYNWRGAATAQLAPASPER